MRSLAMGLSLLALGCAHSAAGPARDLPDKATVFQNACRVGSPQVQPAQDGAEDTAGRLERAAADARTALAGLDRAAVHDPDLLYGRHREEFLRSRERCLSLASALERERESLKTVRAGPQKAPAKRAKAKPKHRKALRVAAVPGSTATR